MQLERLMLLIVIMKIVVILMVVLMVETVHQVVEMDQVLVIMNLGLTLLVEPDVLELDIMGLVLVDHPYVGILVL